MNSLFTFYFKGFLFYNIYFFNVYSSIFCLYPCKIHPGRNTRSLKLDTIDFYAWHGINNEERLQAAVAPGGPVETLHRLENPCDEDVHLIEVQTGDYFGEDDIVRYEDIYGRETS